jgi:hypothetical protein
VVADKTPPIHVIIKDRGKDIPIKITPIRSITVCKV